MGLRFLIVLGTGHKFQKGFIGLLSKYIRNSHGFSWIFQNGCTDLLSPRFHKYSGIKAFMSHIFLSYTELVISAIGLLSQHFRTSPETSQYFQNGFICLQSYRFHTYPQFSKRIHRVLSGPKFFYLTWNWSNFQKGFMGLLSQNIHRFNENLENRSISLRSQVRNIFQNWSKFPSFLSSSGTGHYFHKMSIGLLGQHFRTFPATSQCFQNGFISLISSPFRTNL